MVKFGSRIEEREPLMVIVADGNKISIYSMVKNFSWKIQQTTFTWNVFLIPLGCSDLVLRVWVTWNFNNRISSVWHETFLRRVSTQM